MKYAFYLLIILAALSSCKKQAAAAYNKGYISVNKCQSLTENGETLTCCLESVINDSRCPVDAECIWQGVAVVRFSVSVEDRNQFITLATDKLLSYSKDTTIAGFNIELINLLPHIQVNKPFDYNDYVAEVKITKL